MVMAKRWESRSAGWERERTVSHLCAFRWPTLATTAGCYAAIVRLVAHRVCSSVRRDRFQSSSVAFSSVLAISRRACQVSVRFSLGGSTDDDDHVECAPTIFRGSVLSERKRERERGAELS